MRIVSLVPSWTETLIRAQLNVVGRTRFCIHPVDALKVPAIGGTKDWEWEKVKALKPDILLLDQEENPRFMSEQSEIPWLATHVESAAGMPSQLQMLAKKFVSDDLYKWSERWEKVLDSPRKNHSWKDLPGVLDWVTPIQSEIQKVHYVIWRNPWMVVSADTFIGSILGFLGDSNQLFQSAKKYPEIQKEELDQPGNLLLFSSEPYPFHRQKSVIREFSCASAVVDGESFSWFGVRSLEFLERHLEMTEN